ncbi:uncharacterized protein LOC109802622 [Cajanus cajan]|uniref:uncharacterized protein LOC109802622 n=1 Tax=Cajanus cajan TaxID=3821 RepID=UPI00098DBC6E|nr:uncharacterized protein LOC109802622 [Cajanus cajan]
MEMMAMAMQQQSAHFAQMEASRAATEAARPVMSQEGRDLKIFGVLGSTDERKFAYVVYMLVREVEYWWRGTRQMLESRGVVVDWECFRRVFLEKYFPDSIRYAKEMEFMRLYQGNMTISEYAMKFEHLARFLALVEKAKKIERLEGDGGGKAIRNQEGSSGFKRGEMRVRCLIEVSGRKFRVNLICLPMVDIDIILRMDWFSANHILIDCANKKLVFLQVEDEVLVSTNQAENLLRDGAECFALFATMSVETEKVINGIEVVKDFLEVFCR